MTGIHDDLHCTTCNVSQDPFSTDKKRDACRYYQTGSCRRGSGCPFSHFYGASPIESMSPHPAYPAEQVNPYHVFGQPPAYHPLGLQAHPTFLWQPYLAYPSFDPRAHACQTETFADYPDDKSDPSSAESSSAATSRECQLMVDATWFELGDTHRIGNYATPYTNGGAVFSGGKSEYGQHPAAVSPRSSVPWQDELKKKPLAYKTKPCKFYMKNGKCTSGEKCTFIHDLAAIGNGDKPREPTPATDARLPPKPLDKYEACRAKDFYPITWRVIGGGVMMGGRRKQCPAFAAGRCTYGDDCRLAHETELETDRVGYIEPKNEASSKEGSTPRSSKGKRVRSSSQKPKPIKVPSKQPPSENERARGELVKDEAELETVGEKEREARPSREPTSPVHRRTQSMSMVGSPPPLDKTANYAAEL